MFVQSHHFVETHRLVPDSGNVRVKSTISTEDMVCHHACGGINRDDRLIHQFSASFSRETHSRCSASATRGSNSLEHHHSLTSTEATATLAFKLAIYHPAQRCYSEVGGGNTSPTSAEPGPIFSKLPVPTNFDRHKTECTKMVRFRSICFTLNNYTEDEEKLMSSPIEGIQYLIFGKEVGESGTPHLQGYTELSKQMSLSTIKAMLSTRLHVEARKAKTAFAAIEYCKKDEDWIQWGTPKEPGKRNDLVSAKEAVYDEGMTLDEVYVNVQHLAVAARYPRYLQRIRSLHLKLIARKWRDVSVRAIWGPAGCGKTRWVFSTYPDVYRVAMPQSGGVVWFDDYDGHDTILLDNFNGQIEYQYLLDILDGHPVRIQVKGAMADACWTRVLITSLQQPHDWYSTRFEWSELDRRIGAVVDFTKDEDMDAE